VHPLGTQAGELAVSLDVRRLGGRGGPAPGGQDPPRKYPGTVLSLRPMTEADLPAVEAWLGRPHIARWWSDVSAEAETAKYRERVRPGATPAVHMLTAELDAVPIGWCQWYRWADHPDDASAVGARDEEVGIDYAIGDPARVGRGVGTTLIAALVAEVRRHHPGAGLLADPDAANIASRRVLEKNGFRLVAVRPVATEPTDAPMAVYRLNPDEVNRDEVLGAVPA